MVLSLVFGYFLLCQNRQGTTDQRQVAHENEQRLIFSDETYSLLFSDSLLFSGIVVSFHAPLPHFEHPEIPSIDKWLRSKPSFRE